MGHSRAPWDSVGLSGAQWESVGLSGAQFAMYIHLLA